MRLRVQASEERARSSTLPRDVRAALGTRASRRARERSRRRSLRSGALCGQRSGGRQVAGAGGISGVAVRRDRSVVGRADDGCFGQRAFSVRFAETGDAESPRDDRIVAALRRPSEDRTGLGRGAWEQLRHARSFRLGRGRSGCRHVRPVERRPSGRRIRRADRHDGRCRRHGSTPPAPITTPTTPTSPRRPRGSLRSCTKRHRRRGTRLRRRTHSHRPCDRSGCARCTPRRNADADRFEHPPR